MRSFLRLAALVSAGAVLFAQPPNNVNLQSPVLGQSVVLSWIDTVNPSGTTTYNVYSVLGACPVAAPIPGPPVLTGIVSTIAILTALAPGQYCWAVTAVGAGGESGQSNLATVTLPVGKYDDLGIGAGIQKVGGGTQPVTIGIDNTVTAFVNVGPSVPTVSCGGPNNVFFQTYTNPAGQITIFSIWLCGKNGKWQKPTLYHQT
jgi:hypothetical protein